MTQRSLTLPGRRFVGVLLLAGMAAVGMGCGGGDGQSSDSSSTDGTTSTSADTIEVAMKDFAYEPDTLTIPAGRQVTLAFTNTGAVEHYFVVGDTIASSKDGFEQNLFSGVSIEKRKQTEGHDEEHEEEEGGHGNVFELPPGGSGTMTDVHPSTREGRHVHHRVLRDDRGQEALRDGHGGHPTGDGPGRRVAPVGRIEKTADLARRLPRKDYRLWGARLALVRTRSATSVLALTCPR